MSVSPEKLADQLIRALMTGIIGVNCYSNRYRKYEIDA